MTLRDSLRQCQWFSDIARQAVESDIVEAIAIFVGRLEMALTDDGKSVYVWDTETDAEVMRVPLADLMAKWHEVPA